MNVSLKPLDQQTVVITGASSGIGLATTWAAAQRGAQLVLVARSHETLHRIARQIEEEGGHALAVTADVADRRQMEAVADAARTRFGGFDTWINNAGVSIYGRIIDVSESDARRLFDTNFWGLVNGSLVALRQLREHGGALINVGSEVSEAVVPLQGFYSASKHAVKGFTDALRIELETEHAPVSVTLIQPTAVDTPFPEHARNYMGQEPKLPTPQIEPEDVADAILNAATHATRDLRVGAQSKLNTTLAKMVPGLADKMAARQMTRQQYDEAPRAPEGTLDRPGETGRTHGAGGRKAA